MSGKAVSDFNNFTNQELRVEKVIFKVVCHLRKQLSLTMADSLKFTTQAAKKDLFQNRFFRTDLGNLTWTAMLCLSFLHIFV